MISNLTVKIGADIAGLQRELGNATKSLNSFNKTMSSLGKKVAAAFAFDKLISFGSEMFKVTAQFQKFEAVLTNTLGHNGAAKAALDQITVFASKTPYQVNELTASFVKLANQGFVPTLDHMRKLGDLAASQGKSFDQLTEAIIDAQTGEFERLKEFGVRASKEGDQVTFTFKGVKTQVDFTADAMRKYILSLGDATGVSGGMEAQSKALGGGLSNLKDAWEQMTLAMGKAAESGGLISWTLDKIAAGVKKVTDLFSDADISTQVDALQQLTAARKRAALEGDIDEWSRLNDIIQQGTESVREWWEGQKKLEELQKQKSTTTEKEIKSIKVLKDQLKELNMLFEEATSVNDAPRLRILAAEIAGLDEKIKKLERIKELQKEDFSSVQTRTGGDFLAGLGLDESVLKQIETALDRIHFKFKQTAEKIALDFTPIINSALSGLGQALGGAISGTQNLGQALLGVLGGVLVQLGEMLITAGLGVEAFKASLKSLQGIPAIAAGVALVAIGSAVSSGIKNLGSSAGSSHASAASSAGGSGRLGNTSSSIGNQTITIQGKISGEDIVFIYNRQQQKNGRSKG
jgi:hypothetical protein